MKNMSSLINRAGVPEIAAGIRMLLMDVDGVLTDGKVFGIPDASGAIVKPRDSIPRMASHCNGFPGRASLPASSAAVFLPPPKLALSSAI